MQEKYMHSKKMQKIHPNTFHSLLAFWVPQKINFIPNLTSGTSPKDSRVFTILLFTILGLTPLFSQTILSPGDLAVLAVNANLNSCGGNSGEDEVSFVCFKPIEPDTELQLTDNGWQRRFPDRWGNAEGFITARRTGSTIPAGTIITFRLRSIAGQNDSGYRSIAPDDGWTFTNEAFNTLNFNSGGDQLFFMQGGLWNQGTVDSGFDFQHDATYTGGTILFAFNSKTAWNDFANNSKDSGLPDEVTPCYFMAPTAGTTNFFSYASPAAPINEATQLEWIARIANPNNWTSYADCPSFLPPPESIEIQPSGMSITCSSCIGCNELMDTLTFNLPFGGPYQVTYTNGQDTFRLENAIDGSIQETTVDVTTLFELVSVEDINGCPIYSNFEESAFLEVFDSSISTLDTMLCEGESIVINDTVYDRNNRTGSEVLTTENGCDSTIMINLTFLPGLNAHLLGDTTICPRGSTTLTFQVTTDKMFNLTYTDDINPPVQLSDIRSGYSIEVFPSQSMAYRIVSIDVPGETCVFIEDPDAFITINDLTVDLVPSTFGNFNLSCADSQDGSITATATKGLSPYAFRWNTGDTTPEIMNLPAGNYSLTTTDSIGCTFETDLPLIAPAQLSIIATGVPPGCMDDGTGLIQITDLQGGVPPYEVSYDGQFFQPVSSLPFQLEDLSPGNYTLQVQDLNDCRIEIPVNIAAPPILELDLGPDQVLKLGDSLLLSPTLNFNPENIEWFPREYLQQPDNITTYTTPVRSIRYEFTAIDVSGCTISDEIYIEVDDSRSAYAPTAFHPDSDNANNRFTIYGDSDLRAIKQLLIFDRWGNLIYDGRNLIPNDELSGWDGTYQGQNLGTGVFVFSAILVFSDGAEVPLQGDVLLLR